MRVILGYKNFAAHRNISHIGLGVAALNTMKVLRRSGIEATVHPILNAADLANQLSKAPVDHVIISAPWIPSADLQRLATAHSETQFTVVSHSNVGFLQADRNGIRLIRECMELEQASHNIHLGGNSRRFCEWVKSAFNLPCAYLPNLYYLDEHAGGYVHHQPVGSSGPLRIGIFGATRPLKNVMSAGAAALEVARSLRVPLELWISGGRAEGGGETILSALSEMLACLAGVTLKVNHWQTWPQFRQTVATMHLLLQPSYTESFNMVTADGIAMGVPSVVSAAIDWLPAEFHAPVDDVSAIARAGRRLLHDPHSIREALKALIAYVADGLLAYKRYFGMGQ